LTLMMLCRGLLRQQGLLFQCERLVRVLPLGGAAAGELSPIHCAESLLLGA
jgi:hypothetical protein